jgi:hypothetical protein
VRISFIKVQLFSNSLGKIIRLSGRDLECELKGFEMQRVWGAIAAG